MHAGDKLALDDALEVEVIAPPAEFFGERHPERRPKKDPAQHYLLNLNSLMLRIRHGELVFLFPGDIEEADQKTYLMRQCSAEKLKCTILCAPGHGIHSNPALAAVTKPEVVVACCTRRYGGGPHAKAVYTKVGAKVFVTCEQGRIQIVSDGTKYRVTTERH